MAMFGGKSNSPEEQYLDMILKQAMGVRGGTTTPSQLPMYKYLEQGVTQSQKQMVPEVTKQAMAQGLSGGGLDKLYTDLMEKGITGRLGAEKQAWEGTGAEGINISKELMDKAFKERQQMLDTFFAYKNLKLAQKAQQAQTASAQTGQMTSGFNSAGSNCCFIFIEGERFTNNVRNLRDTMFPKGGVVENGYRKLAIWLVPKMARNRLVKGVVRAIMLNPICSIADHYYGYNSYGWVFRPIGHFWKKVFERLGR